MVRVLLPWKPYENEKISWDVTHYDQHILDQVPHEGISRLVSQHYNAREAVFDRFGLAATAEWDFVNTEAGQKNLLYQAQQISDATLRAAYISGVHACAFGMSFASCHFQAFY